VVGVYLFGFKLDASLEKARETQKDLAALQLETSKLQAELKVAQDQVTSSQAALDDALARIQLGVGHIEQQQRHVDEIVLAFESKKLDPQQAARLQEAQNQNPEAFRSDNSKLKLWKNGITLRILFIGGSQLLRARVEKAAQEWTRFANVRFQVSNATDAEIRVGFETNSGDWSFLGTDALAVPAQQPTMNLDVNDHTVPTELNQQVLRLFGHALGLINEHQNPNANIPWDRDKAYSFFSQRGLPKEQVDKDIFH
jgi:hypothetical protein